MNSLLVVLITTLLLVQTFPQSFALKIIRNEYEIRTSNFLGRDLTFANFKVNLDEDIYLTQPSFCLPPEEACPIFGESPEDNCDYSRQDSLCGIAQGNDSNQTCNHVPYCDQDSWPWMPLNQDSLSVEMNEFETQFLRFYFKPKSSCQGLRLKTVKIFGNSQFAIKRGSFSNTHQVSEWDDTWTSTFFSYCPRQVNYGYGTWFVSVWSVGGKSKVTMNLEFFDVDPTKRSFKNEEQVQCDVNDSLTLCPRFGEPFVSSLVVQEPKFLKISVGQCTQFMVHHEVTSPLGNLDLVFKTDSPSLTTSGYTLLGLKDSIVMTFCPTISESHNQTDLWITLTTRSSFLEFAFYLSTNQEEWNSQMILLSELGSVAGIEFMRGLMSLECDQYHFTCFPGADTLGGSCQEFWNPSSRRDGNVMWPIPQILQGSMTKYVIIDETGVQDAILNNQIGATLLLESFFESKAIVPFPQWEQEISRCALKFLPFSILSTETGEILLNDIIPQRVDEQCDPDKFANISRTIDQITGSLQHSQVVEELITQRFLIDSLTFQKEWQSCDQKIRSLMTEEPGMFNFTHSTVCTPEMMKNESLRLEDPCCNDELEWSSCCLPRTIISNGTFLRIPEKDSLATENNNTFWKTCEDPNCVSSLLEVYLFYEAVGSITEGCASLISGGAESWEWMQLEFYRECKTLVYGEDLTGKPCETDQDCVTIGSPKCDIFRSRCLFLEEEQVVEQGHHFFECLVGRMPVSIRNGLASLGNTESEVVTKRSDEELVHILLDNFMSLDCNGDFGRSQNGATQFQLRERYGQTTCGESDWLCSDTTCPVPLYLEADKKFGRPGSFCDRTTERVASNRNQCEASKICNWNRLLRSDLSSLQGTEEMDQQMCENGTMNGFCGVCTSPSFCMRLEGVNKSECEGKRACVDQNGRFNTTLTEESCGQYWGTCSLGSGENGTIRTKSECLKTGRCSDEELFHFKDSFGTERLNLESFGLCLSRMNEWNDPDCDRTLILDGQDILDPGFGDFPFGSFCIRNLNQTECLKWSQQGFWWHEAARTQTECETVSSCFESKVGTQLMTLKNRTECELCTAQYQPLFTWSQGQWSAGQMVELSWIESKYVSESSWRIGVDFEAVSNLFLDILAKEKALQLVSELYCRVNPLKSVMGQVLCVCDNGMDECPNELHEASVGVGHLCPNSSFTLVAPPAVMVFEDTSGRTGEKCLKISALKIEQASVESVVTTELSLSFREESKRSENVWNYKGTTVGKTLGNGIKIQWNSQHETMNVSQLCLFTPNSDILDDTMELDMGIKNDNRVHPLALNVSFDGEMICLYDVEIPRDASFFPISRRVNWETETAKGYSDEQIIVYSVMFVLYIIPSIVLSFNELRLGTQYFHNRFFNLSFVLALLVRSAYFLGLLIAQPDGSETMIEFIAVEFPTFAYLSAVSGAAMLWALIKSARMRDRIRHITVSVNLLIYLVFVVSTILFHEFQDSGQYSCYGLFYSVADQTNQNNLRIAYFSLICCFALAFCATVLYFSGSLVFILRSEGSGSSSNPRIRRWLIVTTTCSLSVLGQCIFGIIYSLALSPTYQYALVLIPLEILPAMLVIFQVIGGEAGASTKISGSATQSTLPDLKTKD